MTVMGIVIITEEFLIVEVEHGGLDLGSPPNSQALDHAPPHPARHSASTQSPLDRTQLEQCGRPQACPSSLLTVGAAVFSPRAAACPALRAGSP